MAERGSTVMYRRDSRRQPSRALVGLFILFLLIVPTTLLAQNMGQILGRITDSTGSVIVGVHVTGTMQGTGLVRTATTSESGDYVLPALPIGTYNVSVEAPGFKKFENQNVSVEAEHNVHLDATLSPGTVQEQVTVSADASQVDTTSSTMVTTIPQEMVENLPISGNNVIGLAVTLPGVTDVNAPTTFTGDRSGPTLNASGSRSSSNLLLLDGLMHNSLFRGTGQNYPPKDSLAQIQYLSNQYGAMYGHFNGAIVNVITKSGTNQFHGSTYEYAQNSAFNAANYLTHQKPAVHQNQFGTELTGPIFKDRLFFTLAYEGIRKGNQGSSSGAKTLTPAEAAGDLSADAIAANKNPDSYLRNPLDPNPDNNKYEAAILPLLPAGCVQALGSGQYIPGAKIPTACLNPVSQAIIQKYLPAPNITSGPNPGTLALLFPNPAGADNGLGRLDLHFGKHTIDGRYNILQSHDMGHNTDTISVGTYEPMNRNARNQVIAINDTYNISPSVLNVFRVGYNRMFFQQVPTDTTNLADLGANFPGAPQDLPAIQVSSRFNLGGTSTAQQRCINQSFDFLDQVSYIRGNHSLQFGAEFLRMQYLNRAFFKMQGNISFSSNYTGFALADFLLGLAGSSSGETPQIEQSGIQPNYSFFFQDDWKILPRLTLNLGVRYELPIPWYQPQNYWGTFIPGQQSTVIPTAPTGLVYPGDAGISKSLVPTPHLNFAPRVGFAYDLFGDGKTALRGGYGIFYDAIDANIIQNMIQPFVYVYSLSGPVSLSQPLGNLSLPTERNLTNPVFSGTQTLVYPSPNLSTPYAQNFNLSLQQQLPSDVSLGVYYVGKLGRKQLIPFFSNPAVYVPGSTTNNNDARRMYQGFGKNIEMGTIGSSNYNALQVQVRKRQGRYLSLQAAYTWSRSLDEFSSYVSDTATSPDILDPNTGVFNPKTEYGPSDFNSTHIVSLSYTLHGPNFKGHSALVRKVAGGWNLSGIYNIRSGHPLNITTGKDIALSGTDDQRPEVVGNFNLPSDRSRADKINEWFNTAGNMSGSAKNSQCGTIDQTPGPNYGKEIVFCQSAAGTFGNLSRNALIGPASISNNVSLAKKFTVPGREGMSLEFRADIFGIFNTPNLGDVSTSPGSTFGKVTSVSGNRTMQMSLRLRY